MHEENDVMELLLSIFVGLGLSAACGFRVFVPLLILSIAALGGQAHLTPQFGWIGTWPALIAFGVATVLEITGYYIPLIDHFLDTIATPAAVVAGSITTAALVTDLSPFLKWSLAIIAGGGLAGAVQSLTVVGRATSMVSTGGLGNHVVATTELVGAILISILSIALPFATIILIAFVLLLISFRLIRRKQRLTIHSF